MEKSERITVFSRKRGVASAFLSPAILGFVAFAGISTNGFAVVPVILGLIGLGLLAVALFDYPVSAEFDASGITRRCLLRSEHLEWGAIPLLRRGPASRKWRIPKFFRRFHYDPFTDPDDNPRRSARHFGGLVAMRYGSRPYLLVSHVESRDEYDRLVDRMESWSPATFVEATRPPDGIVPTWLGRDESQAPAGS